QRGARRADRSIRGPQRFHRIRGDRPRASHRSSAQTLSHMIILGIGGILGNAASAIGKDGRLVAAVEEVKVSRQYRVGALPEASITACLSMAGAKPEDVDAVAIVRPLSTGPEGALHLQLRARFP